MGVGGVCDLNADNYISCLLLGFFYPSPHPNNFNHSFNSLPRHRFLLKSLNHYRNLLIFVAWNSLELVSNALRGISAPVNNNSTTIP